jgi:hypothetical protein
VVLVEGPDMVEHSKSRYCPRLRANLPHPSATTKKLRAASKKRTATGIGKINCLNQKSNNEVIIDYLCFAIKV